MKKTVMFCCALAVLLTACDKGVSGPQAKLEEAERILAKNVPMTMDQKESVAQSLEEGRSLLAQGETADAEKSFDAAIAVLERAQEADRFNKSE